MSDKVTVSEAARKTKYSTASLYLAIKKGQLAHELSYGRVIVSLAEVRKYKQDSKVGRPRNGDKPKSGQKGKRK